MFIVKKKKKVQRQRSDSSELKAIGKVVIEGLEDKMVKGKAHALSSTQKSKVYKGFEKKHIGVDMHNFYSRMRPVDKYITRKPARVR